MLFKKYAVTIPADVPRDMESTFSGNYAKITKKTDRLFMFACDQKMEHLNTDFYGSGIHSDALHPEHMFKIAQNGYIGALATHLGLIARYGKKYPQIPYIVKLNGRTNLISTEQQDPYSKQLWNVADVIALKKEHGINICGIGYTLYMGSSYEAEMLNQAARIINDAHQNGLVTILWIYPRGKYIQNDKDPMLITGAAGLAATLGTDFVKIKAPQDTEEKNSSQWLSLAAAAAGNTKIICAGGPQQQAYSLLSTLHTQIHDGHAAGCAIGRNIFQHSYADALAITKAISAIVYDSKTIDQALKIVQSDK